MKPALLLGDPPQLAEGGQIFKGELVQLTDHTGQIHICLETSILMVCALTFGGFVTLSYNGLVELAPDPIRNQSQVNTGYLAYGYYSGFG